MRKGCCGIVCLGGLVRLVLVVLFQSQNFSAILRDLFAFGTLLPVRVFAL